MARIPLKLQPKMTVLWNFCDNHLRSLISLRSTPFITKAAWVKAVYGKNENLFDKHELFTFQHTHIVYSSHWTKKFHLVSMLKRGHQWLISELQVI